MMKIEQMLTNLRSIFPIPEYVAPKLDAKNDRAEKRRQAVGSSCEHEKTKAASLNA